MPVTADQAKKLYVRRRRQDSPKYKPAPRWKTCWEKIATKIESLGCDPVDYIEAQFLYCYPFPHPNTMYSAKAEERYNLFLKEHTPSKYSEEVSKSFAFMVEFLESRVNIGFKKDDILSSRSNNFTPLFRYAMAGFLGLDMSKFEEYREAALEEYRMHPAITSTYAQYMGDAS